jgi:hypothetical protein
MKIKLSLFGATLVAIACGLALSQTAIAQMYGQSKTSTSSSNKNASAANPSASPGGKKPGEVMPDGTIVATVITKEEAEKKYPAPKAGYPAGDANYNFSHKPGFLQSPYTRRIFDCSGLPRGSYILDTYANKVFIKQ